MGCLACAGAVRIQRKAISRGRQIHPRVIHPKEPEGIEIWIYIFKVAPELVMAKLPLPPHSEPSDFYPPRLASDCPKTQ